MRFTTLAILKGNYRLPFRQFRSCHISIRNAIIASRANLREHRILGAEIAVSDVDMEMGKDCRPVSQK
jgi:hypothetical protein